MNDATVQSKFEELRRKAEELLKERGADRSFALPELDILSLIHELEVHQVELQLQNEELRRARQELERSRKEYADLYEFAPVGYVSLNKEGTIISANLAASGMLQTLRKTLVGLGFSRFVLPSDHPVYFSLIGDIAGGRSGRNKIEIRLLRERLMPFHAQVEVAPEWGQEGRLHGWRLVFTDISDLKNAEEKLAQYAERLERSNQELQEFAFVASHDLQEPLRKIQVFGDLVQQEDANRLSDSGKDYLRRVRDAVVRMRSLIDTLLQYSRLNTKQEPFRQVDLRAVAVQAAEIFGLPLKKKLGRVDISDLPTIEADASQMSQLFQNLIGNALKYHGETEPVVEIFSRCGEDSCRIFVKDNGIGFDMRYLDRIFQPFQRLHGRTEFEGTGMGLAICRKIVERHGGAITAESKPGKGATFIIDLPRRQSG